MSLEELFPELYSDSVKQMSLSLMYEGMGVEKGFTVSELPSLNISYYVLAILTLYIVLGFNQTDGDVFIPA